MITKDKLKIFAYYKEMLTPLREEIIRLGE